MSARITALDVSHDVISAAMKVHSALGPGMIESVYEVCLAHELRKGGHTCETQVALPVSYDGLQLDAGYRIDILVDDLVIVELKSVERVHPICHVQLISYLKLSGKTLGLLINFNVVHLRDGIKRFVRGDRWKRSALQDFASSRDE
jgi:GxxExxY protein